MKRIETSTKASDLFGPGKHGFTDGDPVNGVLATRLNAEFFNQVQEEIASVVEAYGEELDGSNRHQLLQAIQSAIAAIPPIPEARTHQAGLVELATQSETETGTSETRAVTPRALKKRLDDLTSGLAQVYATMSEAGLIKMASQSDVNTGTSDSLAVTPKTLAGKLDALHFVPPGALMYFAMDDPPEGWLPCKGQTVLREEYPALFAAVGTTHGEGDGETTFNLPDPRGYIIRSWYKERRVGSTQVPSVVPPRIYVERARIGTIPVRDNSHGSGFSRPNSRARQGVTDVRLVPGPAQSMPRNIAFPLCIKT